MSKTKTWSLDEDAELAAVFKEVTLRSLSHSLRSPFNIIRIYSSFVVEGLEEQEKDRGGSRKMTTALNAARNSQEEIDIEISRLEDYYDDLEKELSKATFSQEELLSKISGTRPFITDIRRNINNLERLGREHGLQEFTSILLSHLEKARRIVTGLEHMLGAAINAADENSPANIEKTVQRSYDDVLRNFQLLGESGYDLELETETDTTSIRGSQRLIAIAIYNLVENAVRYAERESEFIVRAKSRDVTNKSRVVKDAKKRGVDLEKITGDWVSITVENTGPIIDDFEELFSLFFTSERSKDPQKGGGSGIGLPTVHAIMAVHGGFVFGRQYTEGDRNIVAFELYFPKDPKDRVSKKKRVQLVKLIDTSSAQ